MIPLKEIDSIVKSLETVLKSKFNAEGDNLISTALSGQNRLSTECMENIQTLYNIYRESLRRENYFAQENLTEVHRLAESIWAELDAKNEKRQSLVWRITQSILLFPTKIIGKKKYSKANAKYSLFYITYIICVTIVIFLLIAFILFLYYYFHAIFPEFINPFF